MKFEFDTAEEFDQVRQAIHDSILYWKKVKQDAQGKICMQCNGEQTHYSVEYAEEQMSSYLSLLVVVDATPHLEWDGEKYVMTEEDPEYYSSMIESNKKYL